VRARERDRASEILFALQGFGEGVVGRGRCAEAAKERRDGERDNGRAGGALPPAPTSPANPGSSHAGRIVALPRGHGQASPRLISPGARGRRASPRRRPHPKQGPARSPPTAKGTLIRTKVVRPRETRRARLSPGRLPRR